MVSGFDGYLHDIISQLLWYLDYIFIFIVGVIS